MTTFGSAIVHVATGKVLDVEVEDSYAHAKETLYKEGEKLKNATNGKLQWAVVRIEVVQ